MEEQEMEGKMECQGTWEDQQGIGEQSVISQTQHPNLFDDIMEDISETVSEYEPNSTVSWISPFHCHSLYFTPSLTFPLTTSHCHSPCNSLSLPH